VPIVVNNFDHFFCYLGLSPEIENFVAVSIVKYHLIHLDGDSRHLFNNFPLFLKISQPRRKKKRRILDHIILIPKIPSKKYSSHISFEKYHCCSRNMLGIKKSELNIQKVLDKSQSVSLIIIIRKNSR